jgi:hypothetical protein
MLLQSVKARGWTVSAQAEPVYWKHTGRTAAHGNEDIELVHDAQARGSDLP